MYCKLALQNTCVEQLTLHISTVYASQIGTKRVIGCASRTFQQYWQRCSLTHTKICLAEWYIEALQLLTIRAYKIHIYIVLVEAVNHGSIFIFLFRRSGLSWRQMHLATSQHSFKQSKNTMRLDWLRTTLSISWKMPWQNSCTSSRLLGSFNLFACSTHDWFLICWPCLHLRYELVNLCVCARWAFPMMCGIPWSVTCINIGWRTQAKWCCNLLSKALVVVDVDHKACESSRLYQWVCAAPAAFGRDTLLCPRWLLESTKPGVNDLWHEILRVTEPKQNVFIDRVIHVHQIMVQRQTSKSQTVRMTMAQWLQEVDVCMS